MAAHSKLSMLSRCHFDLDQTSKAAGVQHYDIRQHRSFIPTVVRCCCANVVWIGLVKIWFHVNKVSACCWMCSGVFLPMTYEVCTCITRRVWLLSVFRCVKGLPLVSAAFCGSFIFINAGRSRFVNWRAFHLPDYSSGRIKEKEERGGGPGVLDQDGN